MRIYKYIIMLAIAGVQILTAEGAFKVLIYGNDCFPSSSSCKYRAIVQRIPQKTIIIPDSYLWFTTGSNRHFFSIGSNSRHESSAIVSLTPGKTLTTAIVGTLACKVTVGTIGIQGKKDITITM